MCRKIYAQQHVSLFAVFKSEPRLPPSAAQAKQRIIQDESVLKSLSCILKKRAYILIMLSYGCSIGSFNAFATLLNQVVLINFPVC